MGVNTEISKRIHGYLAGVVMPRHVSVSGTVSCPISDDFHLDRGVMLACIHEVEPGLDVAWIQQPNKYYPQCLEEKIEINQIAVAVVSYDTLFIDTQIPGHYQRLGYEMSDRYEIKLRDAEQMKNIAKLLVENYHRFLEIETAMEQWEAARKKFISRLDCVK